MFGCGRSGNTISFIMEHEKYSYVEALKWLAKEIRREVEETFVSNEQRALMQTADSLYIINSFAEQFSQNLYLKQKKDETLAAILRKEVLGKESSKNLNWVLARKQEMLLQKKLFPNNTMKNYC